MWEGELLSFACNHPALCLSAAGAPRKGQDPGRTRRDREEGRAPCLRGNPPWE